MRIPLTKYGLPQVAVFPAVILVIMALVWLFGLKKIPDWSLILTESILFIVLLWALAFFRDPARISPQGNNILLAPADGLISDIEVIDDCPRIEGQVLRIGIFLNIFNVHINRLPCDVKITDITYKKGKFKNALDPESARVNESNDVEMLQLNAPYDKLLVRQISGAIARRIVCEAKLEDRFDIGSQFGMIKFGSRTELYLPNRDNVKCLVKVGDKVKAGLTIMVKYEGGE